MSDATDVRIEYIRKDIYDELKAENEKLQTILSGRTYSHSNEQVEKEFEAERAKVSKLREALKGIIEIGKRDMTNPKYDGYFEEARQVLKET